MKSFEGGVLVFFGQGTFLQSAQRRRLGLAAAFGQGFCKVGKQHGKPQPDGNRKDKAGRCLTFGLQGLEAEQRRQDAADVDHKHHRITPLHAGAEFGESSDHGRLEQCRVQQHERFFLDHFFLPCCVYLAGQSIRCSTTGPRASEGT